MIRCDEVVFDALIPIPGRPNAVTQARFCAEDGWNILVDDLGVRLAHADLDPFVVRGYGYSFVASSVVAQTVERGAPESPEVAGSTPAPGTKRKK